MTITSREHAECVQQLLDYYLVGRWYRQLSSTGRLPGGCSRRDVACAVIELRMHVDAERTAER